MIVSFNPKKTIKMIVLTDNIFVSVGMKMLLKKIESLPYMHGYDINVSFSTDNIVCEDSTEDVFYIIDVQTYSHYKDIWSQVIGNKAVFMLPVKREKCACKYKNRIYLDDSLQQIVNCLLLLVFSMKKNEINYFLKIHLSAKECLLLNLLLDGFSAKEISVIMNVRLKYFYYKQALLLDKLDIPRLFDLFNLKSIIPLLIYSGGV